VANFNGTMSGGTGDTITPFSTATNTAGKPSTVGRGPLYIAITPAHSHAAPEAAPAGCEPVAS